MKKEIDIFKVHQSSQRFNGNYSNVDIYFFSFTYISSEIEAEVINIVGRVFLHVGIHLLT